MIERVLSNRKLQSFVRWTTALSFALFTAYQLYVSHTEIYRLGRLIAVCIYLAITVASFLAFSASLRWQNIRSLLMLINLSLLFLIRLLKIPALIQLLYQADILTALNVAAYVLPQLGTVLLVLMCLNRRSPFMRFKTTVPFVPVLIVIYVLCFAAECVMMVRYGMNVELGLKLTLFSRLMYFGGFSGTAFSFLFNDPIKPRLTR